MTNVPDSTRSRLSALDDPPLPPALWPRVAEARRRQLVRRRVALGGGIAVLCAVLVLPGRLPDPDPSPQFASGQAPVRAPAALDRATRLRILDRELQEAYRRGSGETEIAQLWEARAALLRAHAPSAPVRPARI